MRNTLLLFLILPFWGFAQSKKSDVKDLSLKTDSASYVTHYLEKTPKAKKETRYWWTRLRNIYSSHGEYSGYPLHGEFTAYYLDGELKEKGTFRKGLKSGTWRSWDVDGNQTSQYSFSSGLIHGYFETLSNDTLVKGKYRRGKLHGKVFYLKDEKVVKMKRYKHGVLKRKDEKLPLKEREDSESKTRRFLLFKKKHNEAED
jgi:hypothetical protein